MTIAIDFIGTNLGSGTKTYNINFCKELEKTESESDFLIFVTKNYFKEISSFKKNSKIRYKVKSNILSNIFFRLIWMQLLLPFELKFSGITKLYSPMNFSPIFSKWFKISVVLALHSNLPWVYFNLMPGNIIRNYFTKKIMELSIYDCETLIVDSVFAKNEISNILKINANKIKVIYLGISNKYLSENFSDNYLENFEYNTRYILSVLSCVKYHNIINLLKAFKILLDENDLKIKLVLVSQVLDKNYYREIKSYIEKNFQNNQIIIINNLNGNYLLNLYKNAELYIFSSYCEGFGLTSLEAMSQKCPVLISENSALPEINSNACEYFNPDDETDIKNKIFNILENETYKIELKNKGSTHVKKFTWKNNLKNTISELLK